MDRRRTALAVIAIFTVYALIACGEASRREPIGEGRRQRNSQTRSNLPTLKSSDARDATQCLNLKSFIKSLEDKDTYARIHTSDISLIDARAEGDSEENRRILRQGLRSLIDGENSRFIFDHTTTKAFTGTFVYFLLTGEYPRQGAQHSTAEQVASIKEQERCRSLTFSSPGRGDEAVPITASERIGLTFTRPSDLASVNLRVTGDKIQITVSARPRNLAFCSTTRAFSVGYTYLISWGDDLGDIQLQRTLARALLSRRQQNQVPTSLRELIAGREAAANSSAAAANPGAGSSATGDGSATNSGGQRNRDNRREQTRNARRPTNSRSLTPKVTLTPAQFATLYSLTPSTDACAAPPAQAPRPTAAPVPAPTAAPDPAPAAATGPSDPVL